MVLMKLLILYPAIRLRTGLCMHAHTHTHNIYKIHEIVVFFLKIFSNNFLLLLEFQWRNQLLGRIFCVYGALEMSCSCMIMFRTEGLDS